MKEAMNRDRDFQAAAEIGKIYNSFVDKKLLCEFFLDGTSAFIQADEAYLFLSGNQGKLWLESSTGAAQAPAEILEKAGGIFQTGKTSFTPSAIYIPLIVRNSAIGAACFVKKDQTFSEQDSHLAADLASQLASSLKNIFLFEDNLRMERLATIGQTMSAVMHELKNILQLATLSNEFLKMGMEKKSEKSLARGIDGISKALKEMDGFTYEILSLTKDYQIQPQKIRLQQIFDELAHDVRPKADQWQIKLDFKQDENLAEVEGEPRSLYRALLNIVKNAIEAFDENKEERYIRIRAKAIDAEKYELRIEDNGRGMSDEVKAKIFQAFFSTKGEKGTGLGLLIIEKTIKGHQGEIRVESEVGKGTSFVLTMPLKISRV
jgi:signal transduction histidine kinase